MVRLIFQCRRLPLPPFQPTRGLSSPSSAFAAFYTHTTSYLALAAANTMYSYCVYTESWVEISSQPSSSSLSSTTTDEIVTTGLRVQHENPVQRRRRLQPRRASAFTLPTPPRPTSAASSSQEEYDESESESDRVLNSSNEDISSHADDSPPVAQQSPSEEELSDEEDDEDNSTALGVPNTGPVFTPQPNAFTHPPATASREQPPASGSYFPSTSAQTSQRTVTQRTFRASSRSRSHTPYNMISPSHQADHDAALRASLSTLLSCAAAARGLPKPDQASTSRPAGAVGQGNRIEPTTLRMVPESAIMGESEPPPLPRRPTQRSTRSSSNVSIPITSAAKSKRKASSSKERRSSKKVRHASMDEMVSPTLMTWVISAGVVVLFSAISFSAGYAMGKEVGRTEMSAANSGVDGLGCGKEAMRGGFRRLRWGSGGSSSVRV